ncbi:hypothetical protein LXL04_013320 [Taraxacum kok-saghyz]
MQIIHDNRPSGRNGDNKVQILLVVYISRERKSDFPHHFKAGALNTLVPFRNFRMTICFWRETNSEDEGGDDKWHRLGGWRGGATFFFGDHLYSGGGPSPKTEIANHLVFISRFAPGCSCEVPISSSRLGHESITSSRHGITLELKLLIKHDFGKTHKKIYKIDILDCSNSVKEIVTGLRIPLKVTVAGAGGMSEMDIKRIWGSNDFEYVLKGSIGKSGVLCGWKGKTVIFGDFNEVREANERRGTNFDRIGAIELDKFIKNNDLEDLKIGGKTSLGLTKSALK